MQASYPVGACRVLSGSCIDATGLDHFFPGILPRKIEQAANATVIQWLVMDAVVEKEKAQAARLGCANLEFVLITAR
jgi:hypothetical protein